MAAFLPLAAIFLSEAVSKQRSAVLLSYSIMRAIFVALLALSLGGCNATVQYEIGTAEHNNLQQSDR
jgi:hypothetical protein